MELFVVFASILAVTIIFGRRRSILDRLVRVRVKARAATRPTGTPRRY